jgi:hypothetical protein
MSYPKTYKSWAIVALLMAPVATVLPPFARGQSLGELAREQRQKQQSKPKQVEAKKVVTNEDLPAHESEDPIAEDDRTDLVQHESALGASTESKLKQGEHWKAQIVAQKSAVATLQGQMEKLSSSIHYVEANRYYNGVQHNERQAQKQEQLEQMRKQLEEQKQKLADMQETARHAGFGSTVYDP